MKLKIGKYGERTVNLNHDLSFNRHMLVTGKSGSGKTVALQRIVTQLAAGGGSVLVFDYHGIFADDQIFPNYKQQWNDHIENVDAYRDGIIFPYLTPLQHNDGFEEDQINLLNDFTEIFSSTLHFGSKERAYFLEAVTKMSSIKAYRLQGVSSLDQILAQYDDDSVAQRVRQKIRIFTSRNLFRDGELFIKKSRLNVLRLGHLDLFTQLLSMELVLSAVWRYANAGYFKESPLYVVLDECQNLSTGPQSAFLALLTEGRKFGVNLILSTQLLQNQRKRFLEQILLQSSTLLIFRPAESDIRTIAKRIDPSAASVWQKELHSLQVGEFVLLGDYMIGERHFSTPLRISGYEEPKSSNSTNRYDGGHILYISGGRRVSYASNN